MFPKAVNSERYDVPAPKAGVALGLCASDVERTFRLQVQYTGGGQNTTVRLSCDKRSAVSDWLGAQCKIGDGGEEGGKGAERVGGRMKKQKPQHPGFPRGPPPWY